ncbi:hypothetical protein TNCV_828431 [Trichonephila clavipes]|nr:hypothetical protein TNCV_828431 [Trichonephila clavipes]
MKRDSKRLEIHLLDERERERKAKYFVFLQHVLNELLQGVPATALQNVWFMHDGEPVQFSITVRNHLHPAHPGRWIEHDEPVS